MKKRNRRICALVAAAAAMVFTRHARAVTERDDVPDSDYISLGAETQYAASGFVDVIGSGGVGAFGSGTLIAPDWVLTAAHAVTVNETGPAYPASYVTFGQGASTTPFVAGSSSVSQVMVDPGYTGDVTQGSDLALLRLSTPITNVAPAVIYPFAAGTDLGLQTTIVGYGYTGTGLTGYQPSEGLGTRRGATNTFDETGSFVGFSDDIVLTDFDDPNNPDASTMGDSAPTPLEGASVPGDSGGGAFVTVNGQTYLAGVTSFVGVFDGNPYSSSTDGHYGDFNGYMRLSVPDAMSFLESALITNSDWNLAGSGTWASQGSWTGSNIPEYMQATANFGGAIQSNSTVTLDCNWTVGTITFCNKTNSYTLMAGNGGSLTLDNGGTAATAAVINNGGSHAICAPITLNSNVIFSAANSGDVLTIGGPMSGTGGVTISGGGIVRFAPRSSQITLSALAVQTGATLDITSNSVAINYGSPGNSPVGAIVAALTTGYNGGAWTGIGINSSTVSAAPSSSLLSVGYTDGNVDANTAAQANQVLVKLTLAGDANLDGNVDFTDLFAVGQHLNTTGNDWAQGNFTYAANGAVDFNDLFIIGQNLNQTLNSSDIELGGTSVALGQSAVVGISNTSAVPEPTALAMEMCLATLAARRRRRAPRA